MKLMGTVLAEVLSVSFDAFSFLIPWLAIEPVAIYSISLKKETLACLEWECFMLSPVSTDNRLMGKKGIDLLPSTGNVT